MRRPPSAPASTPRPAAACWRSPRRRFRRPLDIGTGTGILAIAAAKRLRRRVWASDIDPAAAAVARGNAAKNGVAGLVRVRAAPGYRDRALRRRRYDLV